MSERLGQLSAVNSSCEVSTPDASSVTKEGLEAAFKANAECNSLKFRSGNLTVEFFRNPDDGFVMNGQAGGVSLTNSRVTAGRNSCVSGECFSDPRTLRIPPENKPKDIPSTDLPKEKDWATEYKEACPKGDTPGLPSPGQDGYISVTDDYIKKLGKVCSTHPLNVSPGPDNKVELNGVTVMAPEVNFSF